MHKRAQVDQKRYDEEHTTMDDDDYEVQTKKRINWDQIASTFMNDNDRLNLRKLEGSAQENELLAPDADMKGIFDDEEESQSVAESFMKVLELRNPEQLTYILLLLSTILRNDDRRGKIFLKYQSSSNKRIVSSFSRVWLRDDISSFCQGKAAICAAIILRWHTEDNHNDYSSLCNFILSEFNKSKNDQLLSPLMALKVQRIYISLHSVAFMVDAVNSGHRQEPALSVDLPQRRGDRQIIAYHLRERQPPPSALPDHLQSVGPHLPSRRDRQRQDGGAEEVAVEWADDREIGAFHQSQAVAQDQPSDPGVV